jgi:hypothetical protein
MFVVILRRWPRTIVFLLALWMTFSPLIQSPALQAQERMPQVAEDLAFTQVVTVGQSGFTEASGPQGIARRVIFAGTRNGARTLYLYDDGVFIEVLPADGTLPNGLGIASSFTAQYRMTPDGDILFRANVSGGSLPAGQYTFRWHNGEVIVQPEAGPNFNTITSDGRWLVEEESGQFPTNTFTYFLTDGTTKEPLISLTGLDSECHTTRFKVHAANANGVVAYTETKTQKSVCAFPAPTFLTEWSLRLGGPISQTMLSGSYSTTFGSSNRVGTGVEMLGSILNDVNQLVTVLDTYNGGIQSRQVVVVEVGGIAEVLFPTAAPPEMQLASNLIGLVKQFDVQGRIAAFPRLENSSGPFTLIRGNNLPTDIVIKMGDPLFGSTVALLQPTFSGYQDVAIAGENRGFYFTYDLADGTKGIGLASKDIPRWANPNGGDWSTAANWTPAAVPITSTEAVFDLPQSYAVNLGEHQIGGVNVSKGDVTFRSGALTVTPFNLAVIGPFGGATPRLTLGALGSSTHITANINVGPGNLQIDNSFVIAPNSDVVSGTVELGLLGPATVTVTNGSTWGWNEMQVGLSHPTQLRLERGAFAGSVGAQEMVIGGGGVADNGVARVTVDGVGAHPGPFGLGTTLGASIMDLTIGQGLVGELVVTNGGSVFAVNGRVAAVDHGNLTDGSILVSGVNAVRPSTFEAGNNITNEGGLFAGTVAGADAQIEVLNGGLMQATFLSLAAAPQSSALMFVDGANGARRSTLFAPLPEGDIPLTPNPSAGLCLIGHAGQGTLNVSNGGLVQCRNIAVGLLSGSRGEINIGAGGSQVIARATADGNGLVCIGGVTSCDGPGTGAQGDVTIVQGGLLEGQMVLVGTGGRIRGSGTVLALEGVHLVGGSVSPGITILAPNVRAVASHTPGALTIDGNLLISPTGVITMHLLGATPDLQDRLVVSGTLTWGGQLAIDFGGSYAPKQGDRLPLIQAAQTTGAPDNVVIAGLAAGFEFNLDLADGMLTLVALNDGVPLIEVNGRRLYLPLVQRPY